MSPAALALLAALQAAPAPAAPSAAIQDVPAACPVDGAAVRANDGLNRSRAALARGALRILAVGSSSIEGVGASRPELGFVPRLEAGLRRRFPTADIQVVNRGIGGETTAETGARLAREIEQARPDLVLWQLGTNDVLRDLPLDTVLTELRRGQAVLDRAGVDVMLIDPQRLPENGANFRGRNPALEATGRLLALEAGRKRYAFLARFDAMRGWSGLQRGGVGPDDLHLNDEGYACWAAVTAEGLAQALR